MSTSDKKDIIEKVELVDWSISYNKTIEKFTGVASWEFTMGAFHERPEVILNDFLAKLYK